MYSILRISVVFFLLLCAVSAAGIGHPSAKGEENEPQFEEIRLTNDPVIDTDPSFSPDMSQIVFISTIKGAAGRSVVHIMKADGKDARPLCDVEGESHSRPLFSPDGKRVFFCYSRGEKKGIASVDLKGADRKDYPVPSIGIGNLVMSPDGKKLVFVTLGDVQGLSYFDIEKGEGGKLVETPNHCDYPVFDHKGEYVYYVEFNDDGFANVCRVKADGTERKILTTTKDGEGFENTYPQPVADGRVFYLSDVKTGEYQVMTMNADGSDKKVLFEPENPFLSFAVNPSGTKVVLHVNTGVRQWEFYLYDTEKKTTVRLTNNQFRENQPEFSPDGKWILYVSDVMGNPEIYKLLVDK
ncbi:MAG: hypothetical protein U5N86_13250 [Planctomycetota bacterium]|nr:hypothetical protein [Planctomycetota bacterium]